jgi:hypothetical protein
MVRYSMGLSACSTHTPILPFQNVELGSGCSKKNYGKDDKAALRVAGLSEWKIRITNREYH